LWVIVNGWSSRASQIYLVGSSDQLPFFFHDAIMYYFPYLKNFFGEGARNREIVGIFYEYPLIMSQIDIHGHYLEIKKK
jgi:hypothetical protein